MEGVEDPTIVERPPSEIGATETALDPTALPPADSEGATEEPTGDDPQAARARKEYRRAQRLEDELKAEREARIAADARFQALDEQARRQAAAKPPLPTRRFTLPEVEAAVKAGTISVLEAAKYVAETDRLAAEQMTAVHQTKAHQDNVAAAELSGYAQLLPTLATGQHPKLPDVKAELAYLVNTLGYANDRKTRLVALRKVFGPLDDLKRRAESDRLTRGRRDGHSEAGGGGSMNEQPTAKGILPQVPKYYLEYWTKRGMTKEEMEREAKYIDAETLRNGRRKSRVER